MTVTAPTRLILGQITETSGIGWKVALWERRQSGCFLVGAVAFRGSFFIGLKGEMYCPEMGVFWKFQQETDQLVWRRQPDGAFVGQMQINSPGSFQWPRISVSTATEAFLFEGFRPLDSETTHDFNACLKVTTREGWFEICPVPAQALKNEKKPEPQPGVLDELVLWVLRPDSPVEAPDTREKPPPTADELKEGEIRRATGITWQAPPENASVFFTDQGTILPPGDPVQQWLLLGAAAVGKVLWKPMG